MSGGSFEYLCFKDAVDLFDSQGSIREMADALTKLKYAKVAASATMELLLEIKNSQKSIQAKKDKLESVWKAIEWWYSGDTCEDDFKRTLDEYRKKYNRSGIRCKYKG